MDERYIMDQHLSHLYDFGGSIGENACKVADLPI